VLALGRGGVAETVDDAVGRTYDAPTAEALLAAIDDWEAAGRPHDPALGRRRAEALALPVFRERLLGYLGEIVNGQHPAHVPPAPHMPLASRGQKTMTKVGGGLETEGQAP
jgi:hypothetical protein